MDLFTQRLLLLLAVLILSSIAFRWRTGNWSRAREYAVLLLGGVGGGVYGAIHNAITFRISWEYFVYWKGLTDLETMPMDAVILGAQAGFIAATMLAGVLLMLNSSRWVNAGSSLKRLPVFLSWPLMGALTGSLVGGFILPVLDAGQAIVDDLYVVQNGPGFLRSWGMHIGSYFGAVVATLLLGVRLFAVRASNR